MSSRPSSAEGTTSQQQPDEDFVPQSSRPLTLAWSKGWEKDVRQGVHSLSSESTGRAALFYFTSHTGVIYDMNSGKQRLLQGHVRDPVSHQFNSSSAVNTFLTTRKQTNKTKKPTTKNFNPRIYLLILSNKCLSLSLTHSNLSPSSAMSCFPIF